MLKDGLSIIIPVLHEVDNLRKLLPHLKSNMPEAGGEIIVSCAVDCNDTREVCRAEGAFFQKTFKASRAVQMNEGAGLAKFKTLYFVHADTLPPHTFYHDVLEQISTGVKAGCYRFKFDKDVFPLMINSFCTRFSPQMFRGGDQSLFVNTELFYGLGGYNEFFDLMEEYPFIKKLKMSTTFVVMPKNILVSTRKYEGNSYVKVNLVNLLMFVLFHSGVSSTKLRNTYHALLNTPDA